MIENITVFRAKTYILGSNVAGQGVGHRRPIQATKPDECSVLQLYRRVATSNSATAERIEDILSAVWVGYIT